MAELKTKKNENSVDDFLRSVEDEGKRDTCLAVSQLMAEVTGAEPKMWGDSIVGFGEYRYKYASGREGEWFLTGFSPRKRKVTLYIMSGFEDYDALLSDLGKYKTGKSCLYINNLDDIDKNVLKELIESSVKHMRESSA